MLIILAPVWGQVPASVPAAELPSGSAQADPSPAAKPTPVTAETRGDVFLARGRYVAAIAAFQAEVNKTAAVYNKLGVAQEHMFLYAQARASFEQALRMDPKFADACNNLATVFHSQREYRQAEKLYKRAIHLQARNADAYQNLGTLYYGRGQFSKGDAAYRRALLLDPQVMERSARNAIEAQTEGKASFELHYHLAKTYAESGSGQLALEYLRKAIAEGFHDRKRLLNDVAFAELRTTPAFLKMIDDLRSG